MGTPIGTPVDSRQTGNRTIPSVYSPRQGGRLTPGLPAPILRSTKTASSKVRPGEQPLSSPHIGEDYSIASRSFPIRADQSKSIDDWIRILKYMTVDNMRRAKVKGVRPKDIRLARKDAKNRLVDYGTLAVDPILNALIKARLFPITSSNRNRLIEKELDSIDKLGNPSSARADHLRQDLTLKIHRDYVRDMKHILVQIGNGGVSAIETQLQSATNLRVKRSLEDILNSITGTPKPVQKNPPNANRMTENDSTTQDTLTPHVAPPLNVTSSRAASASGRRSPLREKNDTIQRLKQVRQRLRAGLERQDPGTEETQETPFNRQTIRAIAAESTDAENLRREIMRRGYRDVYPDADDILSWSSDPNVAQWLDVLLEALNELRRR